jgi:hypothetical protein
MYTPAKFINAYSNKPVMDGRWLFIILLGLFIPHMYVSYGYMQESMMQDLHSRIVGTRLMQQDHSPYFFQWQQGMDARLLNPNISLPHQLSGVTATPFFLWLQKSFAHWDYCSIKWLWWVMQEVLLLTTFFLTCLVASTRIRQVMTIIIGIVFFCYSRNWWLHIHSGQYYILFSFSFALIAFLLHRNKNVIIFLFPVLALTRPFFIVAALPWLFKNFKKNIKLLLIGGIISVALFFVSGSYRHMQSYTAAMKLYSTEITGWNGIQYATPVLPPGQVLEDCVVKNETGSRFNAGSLFSIQHYFKLFNIQFQNSIKYSLLLFFFLCIFFIITGKSIMEKDVYHLLLVSFFIFMVTELFTPANRNPYNMIQYLGIMGVLLRRITIVPFILLVTGLALNHDIPFRFLYQREIGEALVLISIFLVILNNRDKRKAKTVIA